MPWDSIFSMCFAGPRMGMSPGTEERGNEARQERRESAAARSGAVKAVMLSPAEIRLRVGQKLLHVLQGKVVLVLDLRQK